MRTSPARRQPSSPLKKGGVRPGHEVVVGLAFAVAIASVVGAASYEKRNLSAVVTRSHAALDRAGTRTVALLDMRSDLRKMGETIRALEGDPESDCPARVSAALHEFDAARRRYDEGVGADPELLAKYSSAWTALRTQARTACSNLFCGRSQDEIRTLFRASLDRADSALAEIEGLQREQVEDGVSQVRSAHLEMTRNAYAVDGAGVLVAGVLAAVVMRSLRRRRHEIESRLSELEMFAARVAHDLRGPLAPAMLALQRVAARTPKDDRLRDLVDRGERSLHTIEQIIAGLFAFVSSDAGPQQGASASLCETLEDVLAESADAAALRNIHLSLECDRPGRVACSEGVLASIVGNLVGNAIRYMGDNGDQKRIDIRAVVGRLRARVEVADNGPGVPPDAATRIFEPYFRGDHRGVGLGLGLATVKRLVTAHGGSVGVIPNEPHGSIFWIELPIASLAAGEPDGKIFTANPRDEAR
jgi:signal transduction histidine kinase